jgi:hypothetical protein
MTLNGGVTGEQRTAKDVKGSCHGLMKVLSWHLPGWTKENNKILTENNKLLCKDSSEGLQNTHLKHYSYMNLLHVKY